MSDFDVPREDAGTVFFIRSSIAISAPKQKVWDVLVDFPSYSEWNPYIRTVELISDKDKKPLASHTVALGQHVRLRLHTPPTMNDADTKASVTEEIITHFDSDTFRFAWRFATPSRWLITAQRWQVLREGPEGETIYESWEFFGGLAAYAIRFFMGTKLQAAFDTMSHALKERAERAN